MSKVRNADDALVKKVTDNLLEKVYTQEFNDFVQDEEALATDFANEIREKKAFYDLCKDAQANSTIIENNKDNYLFKYYEECKKADVTPLPVF